MCSPPPPRGPHSSIESYIRLDERVVVHRRRTSTPLHRRRRRRRRSRLSRCRGGAHRRPLLLVGRLSAMATQGGRRPLQAKKKKTAATATAAAAAALCPMAREVTGDASLGPRWPRRPRRRPRRGAESVAQPRPRRVIFPLPAHFSSPSSGSTTGVMMRTRTRTTCPVGPDGHPTARGARARRRSRPLDSLLTARLHTAVGVHPEELAGKDAAAEAKPPPSPPVTPARPRPCEDVLGTIGCDERDLRWATGVLHSRCFTHGPRGTHLPSRG